MLNLSNIKSLDYEMPANVMIVHLKKPIPYKGFNTKEIKYKMDYSTFLIKAQEWREFNAK